jgi:hypothetical protein
MNLDFKKKKIVKENLIKSTMADANDKGRRNYVNYSVPQTAKHCSSDRKLEELSTHTHTMKSSWENSQDS